MRSFAILLHPLIPPFDCLQYGILAYLMLLRSGPVCYAPFQSGLPSSGGNSHRNARAFASSSHASLPVTPPAFTASLVGSTLDAVQSGSNQQLRNSTTSLPGSSTASADATKRFSQFFLPGPSSSKSRFRLPLPGGGDNNKQSTPPRGIVVVNPGPRTGAASSLSRLDVIYAGNNLAVESDGRLYAALSCGALDRGVNWETRELARIPRFTPILPIKSTTWMVGGGGGKTAVRPSSPFQTLTTPGDYQPLAEMINRYEEYFQNSSAPILQKQEELTCLQRKVEYESQKVLQLMYDRQSGKAFTSPTTLATDSLNMKPNSSERARAAGSRQLDCISTGLADLHCLVNASAELLRKLTLDVRALQERVSMLTDTPGGTE
uniref:Uncharacterized protein n=3 Tax=Schistocephalus solidus TaxID=70667 RepID=A0A0X3Q3C3_SCHSO